MGAITKGGDAFSPVVWQFGQVLTDITTCHNTTLQSKYTRDTFHVVSVVLTGIPGRQNTKCLVCAVLKCLLCLSITCILSLLCTWHTYVHVSFSRDGNNHGKTKRQVKHYWYLASASGCSDVVHQAPITLSGRSYVEHPSLADQQRDQQIVVRASVLQTSQ